ncbi:unnamed protein product [Ectocarpus sp. 12 AP-2014]
MKTQWELCALVTAAYFSTSWGYTTTTFSDCYQEWISDGMCDSSNNNSGCEYDGGDCCSCDCFDDTYECGTDGFTCLDPSSSCTYHHYYDDDGDLYDSPTYDYYVDDFGDDSFDDTTDDYSVDDFEDDSYDYPTDDYSVDDSEDDFYDSSTSDSLDVEGGGIPSDNGKGSAPVGAIVGGVVGGTAFLAAAAVLVCLFVTGRLKCSKCCSSSDPSAAPAPPAGHGSVQATTKMFPGPAAPAAAAPASDLPPPPAYGSSDHGATSTATSAPPDTHPVHQFPQMK